ncbi:MAG TPA: hypothetical protein VK190_04610 [Pseudoneobacillus sp.]|nr:hypothetical protein [Pseudoneobacillus sp.]
MNPITFDTDTFTNDQLVEVIRIATTALYDRTQIDLTVGQQAPVTGHPFSQDAAIAVGKLLQTAVDEVPMCNFEGQTAEYEPEVDEVEFVVNEEKKTVVALIRSYGTLWAKGKARCCPDDLFDENVGKAIALYRALGLKTPAKFIQ